MGDGSERVNEGEKEEMVKIVNYNKVGDDGRWGTEERQDGGKSTETQI